MKYYLIALIFLLSLGQLQRIQISNNLAFYLHDLLIIGFVCKEFWSKNFLLKKIIEKVKKIIKKPKKIILLFLFNILLAWSIACLENNFDFRAILYLARLIIYLLFVLLLQNKLQNKSWLWRLISFNILVLGFLQYFFLPDLRFLIYEGYDDHFYRLTSTILDPAFTGLIFVFNLNYYLWQKKKNYLLIILFMLGLCLTYSRASYLAFLLSNLLMFFFTQKNSKKIILIFSILFCFILPFLPKKSGGDGVNLLRTISIEKRISNDQEILKNMTGKQWLFGQGLFMPAKNRAVNENIPSHSHFADNFLVWSLSNLGLVGSLLFACLLINFILKQQSPWQKILTLSLLSHAMFNNNFTQSFVVLLFLGFYLARDQG